MRESHTATAILLSVGLSSSLGFSSKSIRQSPLRTFGKPQHSLSTVAPAVTATALNYRVSSYDDVVALLLDARDCANSDSCSIEDAQAYLSAVSKVQEGCAAGHPISAYACEDPLFTMELIRELNDKIEHDSENGAFSQSEHGKEIVHTQDSGASVAMSGNDPDYSNMVTMSRLLGMMYACSILYMIVSLPMYMYEHVTPFSFEEWGYALKDGYLQEMISHYIRNGGL